jgi:hypothetical protein
MNDGQNYMIQCASQHIRCIYASQEEIFSSTYSLSKEPKRLVLIGVVSRTLVFPAKVDALLEYSAHECLGGIPMTVFCHICESLEVKKRKQGEETNHSQCSFSFPSVDQ